MSRPENLAQALQKPSGWRGSRALWLEAAERALIEEGIEAVKIQPLATRLSIARTSFYWFFKDRNALLEALLEDWEAKNTAAFVDACAAYAETISEAVLNLIAVFNDEALFDSRLDFAVRGWARQAEAAMARVNAADARRLAAIRGMFERFGFAPDDADVRARTVYLVPIGDIAALSDVIEQLVVRRASGGLDAAAIAGEAGNWTWSDFRIRIAAQARGVLG